jgi:hypothetical protein
MSIQDELEAMVKPEGQTLEEILDNANPAEPDQKEKETPSDPPAEIKPEEETQSSEGEKKEETLNTLDVKDEPFHKRWQERQEKLNREWQAKLDERDRLFEEKFNALKPVDSVVQVPGWVKKIYGDSQDGVEFFKEFQTEQKKEAEAIRQQIFEEQRQTSLKAQQEQERWTGWVRDQVQELKDEGLVFDQNELQKVAVEFMPTDEEGNIDFRKAYRILESQKASQKNPEKSQARKELAAATISTSNSESKPKDFQTSQSLRNKSFRDLAS